MRAARELIGLLVFVQGTGKRLGRVRDLLVDEHWRVRGIVLEYKSWFFSARYAPWEEIAVFGDDSLMVRSKDCIRKYKEKDYPGLYFLCMGKHRLKGVAMLTGEGVYLGRVEDVYFSQNMEDSIVGFELSEGFLTDLREGRKRLPIPEGTERGQDVIIVPVHRLEEANAILKQE